MYLAFLSEKKTATRLAKYSKRKGAIEYRSNGDLDCNLITSYKFISFNLITFEMYFHDIKLLGLKKGEKKQIY